MRQNKTNEASLFKGMLLDEVVTFDFIKPNSTLVLQVENDKVQSGHYELRNDGAFELKIIYPETIEKEPELIDLICEVYSRKDCPEWLKDDLWDSLNNNSSTYDHDSLQLRYFWKYRNVEKKRGGK